MAVGNTHLGHIGHDGWAGFSHVDRRSQSNYALIQNSSGRTILNASSGQQINFRIGNSDEMTLTSAGRLGIGTTSPTKGLVEINGGVTASSSNHGSYWNSRFGFLNSGGSTGKSNNNLSSYTVSYSLWASGRIASEEFNAFSDERIKNIEGISDSEADLATLMNIEVTNYKLKDSLKKGNKPYKKVIAQQVAEVYPQAVTKNTTMFVPDVYRFAKATDNRILLQDHSLKAGERVRLVLLQADSSEQVIETEVVAANAQGFEVAEALSSGAKVFVYRS